VTVVEAADEVMGTLDPDMGAMVAGPCAVWGSPCGPAKPWYEAISDRRCTPPPGRSRPTW
jgi:hypothetical protein